MFLNKLTDWEYNYYKNNKYKTRKVYTKYIVVKVYETKLVLQCWEVLKQVYIYYILDINILFNLCKQKYSYKFYLNYKSLFVKNTKSFDKLVKIIFKCKNNLVYTKIIDFLRAPHGLVFSTRASCCCFFCSLFIFLIFVVL